MSPLPNEITKSSDAFGMLQEKGLAGQKPFKSPAPHFKRGETIARSYEFETIPKTNSVTKLIDPHRLCQYRKKTVS